MPTFGIDKVGFTKYTLESAFYRGANLRHEAKKGAGKAEKSPVHLRISDVTRVSATFLYLRVKHESLAAAIQGQMFYCMTFVGESFFFNNVSNSWPT